VELLRDMGLFVEVVRTRSFTTAADNLGMPASTLSRRIARLERSLGLTLLTRTTRRVDVTDVGADYFARCAHLVEEARVAHEQIRGGAQRASGTLRLSCTPDFATLYLPSVLETFTRQHPAVNVELDLSPHVVDLYGEPLDAALRIGALPDSTLVARRIGSLRRGLFAAPSYLDASGAPASPHDLAGHMCVRLQAGEPGRVWHLMPTGAPGDEPRRVDVGGRFAAGSVSMVRALVLRGAGIGALDRLMVRDDLEQGRLVAVLPDWELASAPVHLLTVSRFAPARVRLFGDLLSEKLAQLSGSAASPDGSRAGMAPTD
jgi:DNA-binding transcriptional LysR family regulator